MPRGRQPSANPKRKNERKLQGWFDSTNPLHKRILETVDKAIENAANENPPRVLIVRDVIGNALYNYGVAEKLIEPLTPDESTVIRKLDALTDMLSRITTMLQSGAIVAAHPAAQQAVNDLKVDLSLLTDQERTIVSSFTAYEYDPSADPTQEEF